jgi:hypothetical protein
MQDLLAVLWRCVKWYDNRKVIYWQMVVDGLPTSSRHATGRSCYCTTEGHQCLERKHHFWHCPVAAAVVAEVCRNLGGAQLTLEHVWLMKLPEQMLPSESVVPGTVRSGVRRALRGVWMVVCLAALQATWVTAKKIMGPDIRALCSVLDSHGYSRLVDRLSQCPVGDYGGTGRD